MLDPTTKRYPTSKDKGEAPARQSEGRNCIQNQTPYPPETIRGFKQTLCAPGPRDSTEIEPELCLSIFCRGTVSSGLPQRQGLWVQQTWVWHTPSWRRLPLTLPQSCQNLHRTGETDSWRAQTKPCVHQDPEKKSNDPKRD